MDERPKIHAKAMQSKEKNKRRRRKQIVPWKTEKTRKKEIKRTSKAVQIKTKRGKGAEKPINQGEKRIFKKLKI